jgi:Flp pilus assembly pilin Flp
MEMSVLQAFAAAASRRVGDFCADQGGATAIEYAMIAAGVGAFIAASVLSLGSHMKVTFYDKLAALFP